MCSLRACSQRWPSPSTSDRASVNGESKRTSGCRLPGSTPASPQNASQSKRPLGVLVWSRSCSHDIRFMVLRGSAWSTSERVCFAKWVSSWTTASAPAAACPAECPASRSRLERCRWYRCSSSSDFWSLLSRYVSLPEARPRPSVTTPRTTRLPSFGWVVSTHCTSLPSPRRLSRPSWAQYPWASAIARISCKSGRTGPSPSAFRRSMSVAAR
mmetsp:Transcript_45366/g.81195  ORF Transcript_45366/g.81195 Transcript_45366/m.81195 type:complete len:213 (+) Transcript_45366:1724-2362(+)